MTMPTIRLGLCLWCALALAPGLVLVLSGHPEPAGVFFLLWLGGYLLQFGVLAAVSMRTAQATNLAGWLIAALTPWAVVWLGAKSLWWVLPCAGLVIGYGCWLYRSVARSRTLQRDGIAATGVVLAVETPLLTTITNNAFIRRKLRLRIERADGAPPYEAKLSGTFMLGEIPVPGARLALRVDPSDPTHLARSRDTG